MIRVLGGRKRLCDGLSRRDLLQVGSLGMLGLGLGGSTSQTLAAEAGSTSSLPGFGQAKSCIMLFLYGSPSQIETFDPKPDAPASDPRRARTDRIERPRPERLRGTAAPVASDGQGDRDPVGLASRIRSTASRTRRPATRPIPLAMELSPRDPGHWPYIGSVVDYVDGRRGRRRGADHRPCPGTWPCRSPSAASGSARSPGPARTAGSSARRMTRSTPSSSARGRRKPARPWRRSSGTTSSSIEASRPRAGSSSVRSGGPGETVTVDQLDRRRSLLQQLEDAPSLP